MINYTRTPQYQIQCATQPIIPSVTFGGLLAVLDGARGAPVTFLDAGRYMAFIYTYNILQCPMEAIHGRQSLLHNFVSAGTIGYVGVRTGRLGVPFVDPMTYYRHPWLTPQMAAFVVYGTFANLLGGLGGKPL